MPNDTCGNPLLQQWVKEWMEQAEKMNSKAYYTYKKAYDSLSKCPIEYQHPCEAIALMGIGDGMVVRLEKKMMEYCKENGLPMPERPRKGKKRSGTIEEEIEDTTTPVRKRTQKPYIPKLRTGGYAILLALLQIYENGRENVTKEQICRLAQDHCDSSFTMAEGGSKSYTAWNSINTLEKNGYVYKNGRPAKYSLTDTGVDLAKRLKDTASGNTLGSPSGSSSTPRPSSFDVDDIQPLRNPSAARGRKKKSTTSDLMDRFLEEYDTGSNDGLDLRLYVSNPSEHQSISINGRTSTGASSSDNERSSTDILQALADASRTTKRKGSGYGNGGYKKQRQPKQKSRTAALMDSFLANYDDSNGDLNMSNYVMNPQDYNSISLGDRTVHNKPTTSSPASASTSGSVSSPSIRNYTRPTQSSSRANGTSSSVTNSSTSSFARSVMNADNDDTFDWGSAYSSTPKKYSTPSTSTILQADKSKRAAKVSKPAYNVDEYSIDLSPPLLPTFKNSTQSQSNNVVDILSSPESSPALQPTESQLDDDITFDDNFDLEEDYFPMSQSLTKQVKDDIFHYTYLDVNEKDVRSVAQAAIAVDEKNGGIAYRLRCYTSQSDHPKFKCLIKVSEDTTHIGCSIGHLPEMKMDPVCPGLPARPVLSLHREEADDFWPREKISNSQSSIRNDYNERLFSSNNASQSKTTPTTTQHRSTQPSLSQTTLPDADTLPRPSQKIQVDYSQLIETVQPECMLPHEYEIVLVLDSREIQMQKDRDYFRRKIAERGVNIVTRSLDLGDVIWVARKIGSTNSSDEVFLDYIIERKRLDDLVTSIKDGRFVEQKTRLKRSGAEKVIYLVEEYNPQDVVNFGVQAVRTAMSSTQIIDGFFLKRTNNIEESIDYIVSITKLIHTIYKNTTLYTIPDDIITRQNYLDLKEAYKAKASHKKAAYLVNYPMFSALNTKNGCTSLHEIYLRMIMTVKGVNAERALSLLQVYPTPYSLLTAFKGKSVEEAKNLLRDATQHHICRRRWGTAISERLYTIWGALEYQPPGEDENDS